MDQIKYNQKVVLHQYGDKHRTYLGSTFEEALNQFKAGDHVYHDKSICKYKSAVYRRCGNIWKSVKAYLGGVGDWEFCSDLIEYDIADEFRVTISYVREGRKKES